MFFPRLQRKRQGFHNRRPPQRCRCPWHWHPRSEDARLEDPGLETFVVVSVSEFIVICFVAMGIVLFLQGVWVICGDGCALLSIFLHFVGFGIMTEQKHVDDDANHVPNLDH